MSTGDGSAGDAKCGRPNALKVVKRAGETEESALARIALDPVARAIGVARKFVAPVVGEQDMTATYAALQDRIASIRSGDLSDVERQLVAQADTLDAIFNDMARRAAMNANEYIGAAEMYLRLALKAQNQCRATLETLANIKNPPVVIARQANIAHGPQQVNNGVPASGAAGAIEPHASPISQDHTCASADALHPVSRVSEPFCN